MGQEFVPFISFKNMMLWSCAVSMGPGERGRERERERERKEPPPKGFPSL